MSVTIGPYHVGEIPPQLTVTFRDQLQNPLALGGFTAQFTYRTYGGVWIAKNAVVDADQTANKGQVHYVWVAADFAASGDFEAEMWVGNNGPQRYASVHLNWQTLPAILPPLTI